MSALLVRLPNWIGDTVMALPALQALRQAGFALHLVGKGWAPSLLAGLGVPVSPYPAGFRARVKLLRTLGQQHGRDILVMPNSFSAALEARCAGLRVSGHAHEGRGLLLQQSLPLDTTLHQVARFWRLAGLLAGAAPDPHPLQGDVPATLSLPLPEAARDEARALHHAMGGAYLVLCPFSTGTIKGKSRLWQGWPALIDAAAADPELQALQWVVCPGRGEVLAPDLAARAASAVAGGSARLRVLENVGLTTYAALMQQAVCTLSNDSGPSHLAAAVGARQITVLGPSDPQETRPWNPVALTRGGHDQWPQETDIFADLKQQYRAWQAGQALPAVQAGAGRPRP